MTRDELRAHLDRRPPRNPNHITWRTWFQPYDGGPDEAYLGQRSARTGPDKVKAAQPCPCGVCQSAKTGAGRTNGGETEQPAVLEPSPF